MCTGLEPYIGYIIAGTAAAAGTAISYSAAQDQKEQARDLAKQQEAQAQADANFAASEAEVNARSIRKAVEKQRSEARAAIAASGVTVGVGTAEQIDSGIAAEGEQDALMALYDGSNRARQITIAGSQAAQRSRNAASAAQYQAASALASGASTLASGWKTSGKKG